MKSIDFSKFKFLAIDDMGSHRDLLKGMLWQAGVRSIDLGVDGSDAVNKIAKNQYDVILCDYNLGEGQDGQQVLEEVMHRKLLNYNTIYVMITAENASNMVRGAMEYSPDEYLIKPISKEILGHRVQRLLEKKHVMKPIHDATEKNELDMAIQLCDDIANKNKKLKMELAKLKAELCCKAGRIDDAAEIFQQAYDTRQTQWAKLGLGKVALKREDYPLAAMHFTELKKVNADCLEAYDLLGIAYEGMGDCQDAENVLALAAKISPKALLRQRALGRVALHNQHADIALNAFKQAVKLARFSYFHSIDDYIGLAKAHLVQGDFPASIATLSNANKEFKRDLPSQVRMQVMECKIYVETDREEKARLTWDSVKRMVSTLKAPLPEPLIQDLLSAAKLFQDDEIAEIAGIDDQVVKEKVSAALKKYKLLNKEGIKLFREGYLQEAIPKFEQAIKGMPENVGVMLNYIQALLAECKELGVDDESIRKIRRCLKKVKSLDPSHTRLKVLEKAMLELKKG